MVAHFNTMPPRVFDEVARIATARSEQGMLIMLQSNLGFVPFLRNTVCSLQRLNVHNWLVIALDNRTCASFGPTVPSGSGQADACIFPYEESTTRRPNAVRAAVSHQSGIAKYGSLPFVRMVLQKPLWVKWLLQRGYGVLQCDLDTVWLRDPRQYLRSLLVKPQPQWTSRRAHPLAEPPKDAPNGPRVHIPRSHNDPHLWPRNSSLQPTTPDIVIQSEQVHGLNSGFFFARPTRGSIELVTAWLERITQQAGNTSSLRGLDEQHAFNSALLRAKTDPESSSHFSYGSLEDDLFPNGKIWWQYPMWADKRVAYVVHCNWNKSAKKLRLMRDQLWFLSRQDAICAPGFDPMRGRCSKLCVPVHRATPGNPQLVVMKTCARLNSEDDKRARKHGRLFEASKGVWEDLRGQFWHPAAYETLGCMRNLTVVVPYAAQIHERLQAHWQSGSPWA